MRFILNSFILLFVISCGKESPVLTDPVISFTLTVTSGVGGSVSSPGGSYNEGSSTSITATPNSEYVFVNWSNGSTDNPLSVTVNSNQTITANFEKRKYPLTISITGSGTVSEKIISAGKSTTEYTSGSIIQLTANPLEGWGFSGWSGSVSSTENPIQLTVDQSKNVNVIFSEIIPPSITSSLKSKMFTKGVQDTLSISLVIPGGFNSVDVSSELGNISVYSSPENGNIDGEIVLEYTNQSVENVLWDRTIAGHDPIEIVLTDNNQVETLLVYNIRTQPEPLYLNTTRNSSQFYDGNGYRARVNIELVEHLNRRKNLGWNATCLGEPIPGVIPYPIGPDEGVSQMDEGQIYVDAPYLDTENNELWGNTWGNQTFGLGYSSTTYADFNNDGFEDLYVTYVGINNLTGCFGCEEYPHQIYLYDDGEYVYQNFNSLNEVPKRMGTPKLVDFDNDGDIDLLLGGREDGGTTLPPSENHILENRINEINDFIIHPLDVEFDTNYPVDMNFDGLHDIIVNEPNNIRVLYNLGNFRFEESNLTGRYDHFNYEGEDILSVDDSFNTKELYFSIDTPLFYDFDGDGILDMFFGGDDNTLEKQFEDGEISFIPNVSSGAKIYFGDRYEKSNRFYLRFTKDNFISIPQVNGYNRVDRAKYKDIDGDGNGELIIHRLNKIDDQPGEEGHFIQIFKFNGRSIQDYTSQLIENNSSKSNMSNWMNECEPDDRFQGNLRVDDYDSDGMIEIFSLKRMFFSADGYNHIWKWNGSRFIKVSP